MPLFVLPAQIILYSEHINHYYSSPSAVVLCDSFLMLYVSMSYYNMLRKVIVFVSIFQITHGTSYMAYPTTFFFVFLFPNVQTIASVSPIAAPWN